ncbi:MAG: serine acetyltransferase [Rikenellaceae bacterium]
MIDSNNLDIIIERSAEELSKCDFIKKPNSALPNVEVLSDIVSLVASVIFPGYYGDNSTIECAVKSRIIINLSKIHNLLSDQIARTQKYEQTTLRRDASLIAEEFVDSIVSIKKLLITDVEAIYQADPAANSFGEVVFCYPSITAMIHYRIAHKLHQLGVPLIPRIISEIAHSKTGIDIHYEAKIGSYFAIDHGTGVVIGQTCVIGDRVVIYQGVTLGAKGFRADENGNLINEPRHPIIEDDVKIYSNSSILGRITIGKGSVIGGNTWIDKDVAPYSKITQSRPRNF